MNEPTLEQIAMMAASVFNPKTMTVKDAVEKAFRLWDETVRQLDDWRRQHEHRGGPSPDAG